MILLLTSIINDLNDIDHIAHDHLNNYCDNCDIEDKYDINVKRK